MTTAITANVMTEVLRQKAYTPTNAITANVMVEALRTKSYTPVNGVAANVMVEVLRVTSAPVIPPSQQYHGAQFLSF